MSGEGGDKCDLVSGGGGDKCGLVSVVCTGKVCVCVCVGGG